MFFYGKTPANAISLASYLAAVAPRRASSEEIAGARKLSRVLTAKLLTQLSAGGLVSGLPGPKGGYTLARDASRITWSDIVGLFATIDGPAPCPFGKDWCGIGDPCPLHDRISHLLEEQRDFLENTRLSVFQVNTPNPPLNI